MTPRCPNLFVIGAMKCGTSSLHMYLNSHLDIFMSAVKEPAYFIHDDPERLTSYLALFQQATDEAYVGESSTQYTKLRRITGVPQRILHLCPDARLIYITRDPIRRVLSHYRFAIRKRDERRDLWSAVMQSPDYVDFSNYPMQLEPYLDLYGKERIFVLTLEELQDDPESVMDDLFIWLGVDPEHSSHIYAERANVTPGSHLQFRRSSMAYRALRSATWRRWGRRAIPDQLRTRVRTTFTRSLALEEKEIHQLIDYLRPIQQPQVEHLSELLDRDFPLWTTLNGSDEGRSLRQPKSDAVGTI